MASSASPRAAGAHHRGRTLLRRPLGLVLVAAAPLLLLATAQPAGAGIVATVPLGTAAQYSVLGATTVTNTNGSVLAQSVGLSPGTSIVGFPPGIVLPPAVIEAANATTLQAQIDLTTAYGNAAARPVEFTRTNPDLAGATLIPGVYAASSKAPLQLSGPLVLDGQNNPDAVFIFQTDSTLITGSASSVQLINGASACNVFWQVGSSATLGSGSTFTGTILALASVTVGSGATVHGRALARTGAVTLDDDVFTRPSCTTPAGAVVPVTPTTTAATTTTATTTDAAASAVGAAGSDDTTGADTTADTATNSGAGPTGGSGTTANGSGADLTNGGVPRSLPMTGATSATRTALALGAIVLGAVMLLAGRRTRAGVTWC